MEDYFVGKPPNMDSKNLSVDNWSVATKLPRGRKTFLNDVIRLAKKNPSPNWRCGVSDWASQANLIGVHGHGHKDEFPKGPRETIPVKIAK